MPLAANIRAVIHRVDPSINVNSINSGEDIMYAQTTRERTIAQVSSGFSLFALTLACLGLYGVLAYNVTLRTREIGVRMALGAQTGDITSLIVNQGVTLAVIGCALGVAAAIALSRFVVSFLYGVSAIDPLTLAVAVVILTLVAFLASWLPARRATRIDPMIALRYE